MRYAVAFLLALQLLALHTNNAEGSPLRVRRQFLPERPGYIPVYIQLGDQPPSDPLEYERLIQEAVLSRSNSVSLREVDNKVNNEQPPAQLTQQILSKEDIVEENVNENNAN